MRISTYTSVSYEQFDALFRATYGRGMPRDVFDWKYGRNPHGPVTLWAASEDGDDNWLGALALFPRRFRHGSRTLVAGQLADGMVSASARFRGIFRQLLNRVWEEHARCGYDLLFGLAEAGGMSVHALRKMEFLHEVGLFQDSVRFLQAGVANELVPVRALRGVARWTLARWLAWVDRGVGAWNERVGEGAFSSEADGFVVDDDWVSWRLTAPGKSLSAYRWSGGGAIVASSGGVAEITLLRPAGGRAGLVAFLRRLREKGYERAWLSARIPPGALGVLRAAGFIRRDASARTLVLFAGSSAWEGALARQFELAWVSTADLDVP